MPVTFFSSCANNESIWQPDPRCVLWVWPPSQNNEENEETWRRLSHGCRDGTLGSLFVPSLCPLSTAHCIAQRPPVPHSLSSGGPPIARFESWDGLFCHAWFLVTPPIAKSFPPFLTPPAFSLPFT